MSFRKLQERVKQLEEEINKEVVEKVTVEESTTESTRKQILLEMKKIGIEKLPYSYSALDTFIDKETMYVHYNKHYKGYVDKLNKAIEKKKGTDLDLEQIVKGINRFNNSIKDNAGGAFNHALFWKMLTPKNTRVYGPILRKIKEDFGSYDEFKNQFEKKAKSKFGSGWVWLVVTNNDKLKIMTTSNQDNPLMNTIKFGGYPILGLDLWEHAYYLKYRNRRDEYIANFWKVVNWPFVNKLYLGRTKDKIKEGKFIQQVINEGVSAGCNSKQVNTYRMVFNRNPQVKKKFMFAIMDILKEVFSDYWFEKNEYAQGQMSGVYDYEQPGRSVINKLNTNYTAFCTLVNDINLYLKKVGINPINFIGLDENQQLSETDRLIRYMTELRYRIFNPESSTFQTIMSGLDRSNKFGDKREINAVINLKDIFGTKEVYKVGELGGVDDMLGGVDAYVVTPEGKKTMQIKPFNDIKETDGKLTVYGSGNVKPYKTDYLVFHNDKDGTVVFKNNAEIIDGRYVFNSDDRIN